MIAVSYTCIVSYKKFGCRREAARCFLSLNISLSHSRSFNMAPFDRSHTSSCWRVIVTMATFCIICEIKRYICKKSRFFVPLAHSTPSLRGHWILTCLIWKKEWRVYSTVKKLPMITRFDTIHERDWQRNRQTDRHRTTTQPHLGPLCIASLDKNVLYSRRKQI